MGIVVGWIILSFIVGGFGSERTCGFFGAFLGSLVLSPIIGIFIVLMSSKTSTIEFQKLMVEDKKRQLEKDTEKEPTPVKPAGYSAADYLADMEQLDKDLDNSTIDRIEYERMKEYFKRKAGRV